MNTFSTASVQPTMNAHRHLAVSDLSPDQRVAYDAIMTWLRVGAATKKTLSLGGYAGCLAGSTIVDYSRGSRVGNRPITMEDLYLKFNGLAGSGRGPAQRWVYLTVPTFLPSLWPDGTVSRNRVIGVLKSGIKPVLRVDFSNGKHLVLTADHPVATPSGEYIEAGALEVGETILARGSMLSGKGKGRRPIDERLPRIIINTKYHPGPSKTVWSNGVAYDYVRVARARLVVEAAMNDVSYEEFVHALKHNAGASAKFKYLPGRDADGGGVDVHHIDEDTLNDDISNLEILPHAEHARLHGSEHEQHFHKNYTREVKVARIRKAGEVMTYDVQMEPPANNFVANGIFVHNSGKSALISVLAHEMPSPLAFCAFTGKASSVLGRKLAASGIATVNRIVFQKDAMGGRSFEPRPYCGTIHGLVYRPCDVCMVEAKYEHTYGPKCHETPDGGSIRSDVFNGAGVAPSDPCLACNPPPPVKKEGPCTRCQGARYLRRERLDRPYRLIVVDEASMVSDDMLQALLSFGVPILAVGDHGQLPPVKGTGSLMKSPDIKLEKIHRQAAGNPIIALSARIRETGDIDDALEDGDAFTILARRNLGDWISSRFSAPRLEKDPATREGIMGTVLVSWTNRLRVGLNYDVRDALGREGEPKKGEAVICLKNAAPIYNGMRGIIEYDTIRAGDSGGKAPKWKASVDFVEDGQRAENVLLSEHQFFAEKTLDYDAVCALGVSMAALGQQYDFGYALTCHKMQGSQAAEVGVVLEPGLFRLGRDDRARWIYTAVTRSAEKLTVIRG